MAKVVTCPQGGFFMHPHGPRTWDIFNEYTTQQTNAVVKRGDPAVRMFVTDIFVQANAAVTITLFKGSASTSPILLRFIAGAQADGVARSYVVPKMVPPNTPITITTSGAVTVEIEVHGFLGP